MRSSACSGRLSEGEGRRPEGKWRGVDGEHDDVLGVVYKREEMGGEGSNAACISVLSSDCTGVNCRRASVVTRRPCGGVAFEACCGIGTRDPYVANMERERERVRGDTDNE